MRSTEFVNKARKEIPISLQPDEITRLYRGELTSFSRNTAFFTPGDLLWLKEDVLISGNETIYAKGVIDDDQPGYKLIPALFMPKRYARAWMLVTNISGHPQNGFLVDFELLSKTGKPALVF